MIAYMGLIFVVSSRSSLPSDVQAMNDKLLHGAEYGALSFLLVWAATQGRLRPVSGATVAMATVVSTVYGLSDEIHQWLVPPRAFELRDLLADATGAFVAAGSVWVWGIISRGPRPETWRDG
ncbi:MAG: VanZ family protein [Acidobacteriota bacterium]